VFTCYISFLTHLHPVFSTWTAKPGEAGLPDSGPSAADKAETPGEWLAARRGKAVVDGTGTKQIRSHAT
jgi:hypothetical protein